MKLVYEMALVVSAFYITAVVAGLVISIALS